MGKVGGGGGGGGYIPLSPLVATQLNCTEIVLAHNVCRSGYIVSSH